MESESDEHQYKNAKEIKRFSKLSRKRFRPENVAMVVGSKVPNNCVASFDEKTIIQKPYHSRNSVQIEDHVTPSVELIISLNAIPLCSLPNIGSTCFFNSVMQVLRFTPGFLVCLHQMTNMGSLWKMGKIPLVLKQFHNLFFEMKLLDTDNHTDNVSLTTSIKSVLDIFSDDYSHYKIGQQFDAHEFLSWVLKIMMGVPDFSQRGKKAVLNWGKRKTSQEDITDFKRQFLNGVLSTHVICCECETPKSKTDEYWDLAFHVNDGAENDDLPHNSSLLDLVCEENILRDDNKFLCEGCLHLAEAKIKIEINSFPPLLIFHPNQSGDAYFSVYTKRLNSLPIQEIISCSHSNCEKPCNKHVYQIYAVIVHIGTSTQSGHYVALINTSSALLEAHQTALEEKVVTQTLTRSKRETSKDTDTKKCCLPNRLMTNESLNGWILFDDDNIETCKFDNIKTILLEELGTTATPSVLLYFRC